MRESNIQSQKETSKAKESVKEKSATPKKVQEIQKIDIKRQTLPTAYSNFTFKMIPYNFNKDSVFLESSIQ